jgi:hypothetical protein
VYYTFLLKRASQNYDNDEYEVMDIIGATENSPADVKPGHFVTNKHINNFSANGHIVNIYPQRTNQGYDFKEENA